MTSEMDAAALGVGRDVGTLAPKPAVTVTGMADVASAIEWTTIWDSADRYERQLEISYRSDVPTELLVVARDDDDCQMALVRLTKAQAKQLTAALQAWLQQGFNGA